MMEKLRFDDLYHKTMVFSGVVQPGIDPENASVELKSAPPEDTSFSLIDAKLELGHIDSIGENAFHWVDGLFADVPAIDKWFVNEPVWISGKFCGLCGDPGEVSPPGLFIGRIDVDILMSLFDKSNF